MKKAAIAVVVGLLLSGCARHCPNPCGPCGEPCKVVERTYVCD